jgi:ubiquinone/menaquinone biosynthesis C-methylase UbiE
MARNSANLYLPIIEELKPKEPWLDLAGGPGMLGYYAEKPVYVVDLSHNYLKKGKELETGHHINGSFSAIPCKDEKFGMVLCSLAYQMSGTKKERSEVLMEMNRVMKDGGHAILTLPTNYMTDEDRALFDKALNDYGFKSLDQYHAIDQGPSKIEIYILKKTGQASYLTQPLRFKGDR